MNKDWRVKLIILLIALIGVIWLMFSVPKGEQIDEVLNPERSAKVITQPPKPDSEPTRH